MQHVRQAGATADSGRGARCNGARCPAAQTCKAVERLVAIWEERRVFGASGAKPFKEIIATAPSPRKSHALGARRPPGRPAGVRRAARAPAQLVCRHSLCKGRQ